MSYERQCWHCLSLRLSKWHFVAHREGMCLLMPHMATASVSKACSLQGAWSTEIHLFFRKPFLAFLWRVIPLTCAASTPS